MTPNKTSAAKRRSNNAWDAKNMKTVSCRLRCDLVDEFAERAKAENTSPHALIKSFILSYLDKNQTVKSDEHNEHREE